MPLRLEAPAKLNLSLAVVGRRDDGYHELVSELLLLELADRLLLMPGCSGLRVEGEGAGALPLDEKNLAWLGLRVGLGRQAELECLALEKHVPVAAGLGGGSSDAAAAWRLGRRWVDGREEADAAELVTLARIGADVPFFAARLPAARVEGIGERVTPMPAPATQHVVLAHPPFPLRTAAVFGELRQDDWGSGGETGGNDLLAPARRLRPELDEVFSQVAAAGGEPRLSGSGPTVYSLTDDPERASGLVSRLELAGLRATQTHLRGEAASIEVIGEAED